jgi:hypothetical protein
MAVEDHYPAPTAGLMAGYIILAILALFCAVRAFRLGSARSQYRGIYAIRYLLPLSALVFALENATLASSGGFHGTGGGGRWFLHFVSACITLEVPMLLLATFEIMYLVHKRRSVNFCGMFFDEGQRVRRMITTPIKSFVLRNSIRVVAVVLTAVGLITNFELGVDGQFPEDQLCGWVHLFRDKRPWEERVHLLLTLLPVGVLIVCNAYFSFHLWRYGTESSMVVHASILNPWFSLSFGTGILAAANVFGGPPVFQCTSNVGLVVFLISILLVMVEVNKDIVAADEFGDFLAQASGLGDAIAVRKKRRRNKEGASSLEDGATNAAEDEEGGEGAGAPGGSSSVNGAGPPGNNAAPTEALSDDIPATISYH